MLKHIEPKTLYQYTTHQELMNVLDNRSLRLKSISYIDSGHEFLHIVELGVKMFWEQMATDNKLLSMYCRDTHGDIYEAICEYESEVRVFSCSFYEDGDHYSRWQVHGACGGYSLGFGRLLLKTVAKKHSGKFARCVYERQKQRHMIVGLIEKHENIFRNIHWKNKPERTLKIRAASRAFYAELALLAAFTRNTFYKDEKEWRMVVVSPSSAKGHCLFVANGKSIEPYYHLPLCNQDERLWLNDLNVGPSSNGVIKSHDILSLATSKSVVPRCCGYSKIQLWKLRNGIAGEYLGRVK